MKRAAVVDIGTNSVKLTVADIGDDITIIKEASKITRLGRNVDSAGRLNAESVQKTLEAIQEFTAIARELGALSIVGAGTSALRDASNGADLIDKVKQSCGLTIEIIKGEREAALAFRAVTGDPLIIQEGASEILVFDIGGGSTELIFGHGDGTLTANVSLNIGALRLTERHFQTDPPTDSEFDAAKADGANAIGNFIAGKKPSKVCGVGGTASTIAAMVFATKDVHGKTVAIDQIAEQVNYLRSIPLAERRQVPFLEPDRADIIIAGTAILMGILAKANTSSYTVSLRGMRFGLLLEQKAEKNELTPCQN